MPMFQLREQFLFSVSIEAIASRDRAGHTGYPEKAV
jgi:hypothetical protein